MQAVCLYKHYSTRSGRPSSADTKCPLHTVADNSANIYCVKCIMWQSMFVLSVFVIVIGVYLCDAVDAVVWLPLL